ncbi:hypothetical protein F0U61_15760 [Archangium violaceum]|uniref:hypothetical protein n=1 Tax=Archangium violaceum TaxID=83451 RepID=UPI002B27C95D|nr:hypothetical protein F0U61_15760 [Archangium violaceum]
MFSLVLALLVAQNPVPAERSDAKGLVVMVSRSEGLTPIESVALADRLSRALWEARLSVAVEPVDALSRLGERRTPESCQGKPECFARLGRELGVAAVVTIDSSKVFDDLPMRITVMETQEGRVLFKRSYTASALRPKEVDSAFERASQDLAKTLSESEDTSIAEALRSSDAPRAPNLSPPAYPASDLAAFSQPTPLPVTITRIGAGAAAVTAVTFLVLGLVQASRLQEERAPGVSAWTHEEAMRLRSSANTRFALSGVFAGVSGALFATSFVLPWEPSPAK